MPGFPATPLAPPVSGPLLWPWSRRGAGGPHSPCQKGLLCPRVPMRRATMDHRLSPPPCHL